MYATHTTYIITQFTQHTIYKHNHRALDILEAAEQEQAQQLVKQQQRARGGKVYTHMHQHTKSYTSYITYTLYDTHHIHHIHTHIILTTSSRI